MAVTACADVGSAVKPDIRLRRGTQHDRDFVLDLGRRTSADSVSTFRDAPRAAIELSYERLVEFVTDRSHVLVIAETDVDGPLGFILMLDDIPDEVTGLPQAFVAYMAVEPHARRSRVGGQLLRAAEDAARARGLPNISLMVTEDNLPARRTVRPSRLRDRAPALVQAAVAARRLGRYIRSGAVTPSSRRAFAMTVFVASERPRRAADSSGSSPSTLQAP